MLAADEPEPPGPMSAGSFPGPDAAKDWKLLHDLFSEVHLAATGWNKVVSDVEKALAGSGQIGTHSLYEAAPRGFRHE
jgi:hypothetical protein